MEITSINSGTKINKPLFGYLRSESAKNAYLPKGPELPINADTTSPTVKKRRAKKKNQKETKKEISTIPRTSSVRKPA